MLKDIFGNAYIAHILLFLYIHKTCYGAGLRRALGVSLTPIQNAIGRLERMGLIEGILCGKTKVYALHRAHPLHQEIYDLVRKSYALLTPDEKKRYLSVRCSDAMSYKELDQELLDAWTVLQKVKIFSCRTVTHSKMGDPVGVLHGAGKVAAKIEGKFLLYSEKGVWQGDPEVSFSNKLRWTMDRMSGMLSIEHLRHGESSPVFLFHLRPSGKGVFFSLDAHVCGQDAYIGRAVFSEFGVQLVWRILGPHKDQEIEYRYGIL